MGPSFLAPREGKNQARNQPIWFSDGDSEFSNSVHVSERYVSWNRTPPRFRDSCINGHTAANQYSWLSCHISEPHASVYRNVLGATI